MSPPSPFCPRTNTNCRHLPKHPPTIATHCPACSETILLFSPCADLLPSPSQIRRMTTAQLKAQQEDLENKIAEEPDQKQSDAETRLSTIDRSKEKLEEPGEEKVLEGLEKALVEVKKERRRRDGRERWERFRDAPITMLWGERRRF